MTINIKYPRPTSKHKQIKVIKTKVCIHEVNIIIQPPLLYVSAAHRPPQGVTRTFQLIHVLYIVVKYVIVIIVYSDIKYIS